MAGDIVKYNRADGGDFDFSMRVLECNDVRFRGEVISSTTSAYPVGRAQSWQRGCFRYFTVVPN